MRTLRITIAAVLGLAATLAATGCITFPQIKDRVIHLATNGSVRAVFHAQGSLNNAADSRSITLGDSLDIPKLLSDAGIDIENVDTLTLATATYRILVADANPSRTITGTVSIQGQPLVSSFNASAGAVTGDMKVALNPAGVAAVNALLAHVLGEVRQGAPVTDVLTYGVVGTSNPTDAGTDFYYQIKLTFNVVGHAKTKMIT